MTTLDRAFIKAFSERPSRAPASPPPVDSSRLTKHSPAARSPLMSAADPVAPLSPAMPADATPANAVQTHAPVQAAATQPAPAQPPQLKPISKTIVALEPLDEVAAPAKVEMPKRMLEPILAPKPLSSFATELPVRDSFSPMLEIDRAKWPLECLNLLARAKDDWQLFGERIHEQLKRGKKCVAIAGIERGEGRTTVTLALAKLLAATGLKTALVDADLDSPALDKRLGVATETGWDDLVSSELALGEALVAMLSDGVTLMPWHTAGGDLSQVTRSLRTPAIFGTLREHYDLVLFDASPLGGPASAERFAKFAAVAQIDTLYLVHNTRTTPREQLVATCQRLQQAGLPAMGIIENYVSATRPGAVPGAETGVPLAGGRPSLHA